VYGEYKGDSNDSMYIIDDLRPGNMTFKEFFEKYSSDDNIYSFIKFKNVSVELAKPEISLDPQVEKNILTLNVSIANKIGNKATCTVNWGDGTFDYLDSCDDQEIVHNYVEKGSYKVEFIYSPVIMLPEVFTESATVSIDSSIDFVIVEGKVIDEDNVTLSGINIDFEYLVNGENKNITTKTDNDGKYSLKIPEDFVPNKKAYYVLTAYDENNEYLSESKNVTFNTKGKYQVNFVLSPKPSNIIVLDKEIHHLGDDRYSGTVNSQFQKKAEGISYEKVFTISRELYENYDRLIVSMKVKGSQYLNKITLNDKEYYITNSPSDGSYEDFSVSFEKKYYNQGENLLKIISAHRNDYDDFEFSNIILEFEKDELNPKLNNKNLVELGHYDTNVTLNELKIDEISGKVRYEKYKCEADLKYLYKNNIGYQFVEENMKGNCEKDCFLLIDEDGDMYKRNCPRKETIEYGYFDRIYDLEK